MRGDQQLMVQIEGQSLTLAQAIALAEQHMETQQFKKADDL
jgi:hypothetical protein